MKKDENKKQKVAKPATSKKTKIILLSTLIPLAVAGATTGIVLGVKSCKSKERTIDITCSEEVNYQKVVTSEGNFEITVTPKDTTKTVSEVTEVTIGNTKLQPDQYKFDKATGKITITKSVLDANPGNIVIKVNVSEKTVKGIELSKESITIKPNESFKLTASLTYAMNAYIDWSVDTGDMISFPSYSESGKEIEVKSLGPTGTVELTARYGEISSGIFKTCVITIKGDEPTTTTAKIDYKDSSLAEFKLTNTTASITMVQSTVKFDVETPTTGIYKFKVVTKNEVALAEQILDLTKEKQFSQDIGDWTEIKDGDTLYVKAEKYVTKAAFLEKVDEWVSGTNGFLNVNTVYKKEQIKINDYDLTSLQYTGTGTDRVCNATWNNGLNNRNIASNEFTSANLSGYLDEETVEGVVYEITSEYVSYVHNGEPTTGSTYKKFKINKYGYLVSLETGGEESYEVTYTGVPN